MVKLKKLQKEFKENQFVLTVLIAVFFAIPIIRLQLISMVNLAMWADVLTITLIPSGIIVLLIGAGKMWK